MRVVTLNVWGAPYAQAITARLDAICQQLPELNPDVILLQEVYLPRDRTTLRDKLTHMWPHQHYFASGLIGSGLLTVSRFPIVDAAFHRFRMGGKPERLQHGDYYAGKGIGFTRLQTLDGDVAVFNCHTHAQYEVDADNEYAVVTNTNLYEAARFISAQADDNPVIVGGDLNVRPDEMGYRIIGTLGQLTDAYWTHHDQHPVTFAADNPYTSHDGDKTLDYLLIRGWTVNGIERAFDSPPALATIKGYSDHYALVADLTGAQADVPTKDHAAVGEVMGALYQQVRVHAAETQNARDSAYERAGIAMAGLLDIWLISGFIGRWLPRPGKWLRRWLSFAVVAYALSQALFALLGLTPRVQTLEALESELDHQVRNRQSFDGREW